MKSPFPGMDPYLERHWGDVHSSIITFAKQALQPQLGGDLVARSEERVYIDDDEALRRQHRVRDVRVCECLAGRSNLVEVDLTRAGKREMLVQDFDIPDSKRGDYLVSVFRATVGKFGRREGYGLKLRERLPGIRIPLRAGDPDVVLDLQALIDQAYEAGAYGKTLDYNRDCDPSLPRDHERWADELLRAAGGRR